MHTNWGLLGHEWAVDLLRQHVIHGPRHAYLFTGPAGVGRRTLALRFAQALNADHPPAPGEFDPASRTSQQLERMQHADLSVVQVAEDAREIKIEQIRDLGRGLALAPYMAAWKIALLLNLEQSTESAQNALLKTLEEPPARVILLLTAESAEALLPTIVSRCETLRLRPLGLAETAAGLHTRFGLPADQADLLAHISGGRPGAALRLHAQPETLAQRAAWLDDLAELLAAGVVTRFAYVEKLSKDKPALLGALEVWLSYWRDVMLRAGGAAAPLANPDRAEEIEGWAAALGLARACQVAARVAHSADLLQSTNTNPRLVAEVLFMDFPAA